MSGWKRTRLVAASSREHHLKTGGPDAIVEGLRFDKVRCPDRAHVDVGGHDCQTA